LDVIRGAAAVQHRAYVYIIVAIYYNVIYISYSSTAPYIIIIIFIIIIAMYCQYYVCYSIIFLLFIMNNITLYSYFVAIYYQGIDPTRSEPL